MKQHFSCKCYDCQTTFPFHPLITQCPACSGEWFSAEYDLTGIAARWSIGLPERPASLWRYAELLPVSRPNSSLSIGEGGTPLLKADNLGAMLGLRNLYIKDERRNPTSSFKDRQAAVTTAVLDEFDLKQAVVCSTGNVAIAYSSYCARASIKLWAFLTSLVPAEKMHEVAIYGTQVIKITGTYDQAKKLAAQFAHERGIYLDRGARSIPGVESMKTIAFEIAEQLALTLTEAEQPAFWISPDWYIQSVSGGLGPMGVLKGFKELRSAQLIEKVPSIGIMQVDGCAPMAAAWKANLDTSQAVEYPQTHITTLTTGDPGRAYTILRQDMLADGGGTMESVSDEEAYRAMHMVAKIEGLSIEPAAAVAFAGLFKLVHQKIIQPDQIVVVNCSGHTLPVEKALLGDDWSHDLSLGDWQMAEALEEGFVAALISLDQQIYQRILVVDDQPEARRLIRRVLDAHGDFAVEEVDSGPAALESIRHNRPDLMILDLMMPEMDGFSVLDRLRTDEDMHDFPVIVVTAKELTRAEIERLKGQITKLLMKGDFLSDELLDEIDRALGDGRAVP
jgi:threonine synthase